MKWRHENGNADSATAAAAAAGNKLSSLMASVRSRVDGMLTKRTTMSDVQVVQEYERAVIFRLGRLLEGGTKGPGLY